MVLFLVLASILPPCKLPYTVTADDSVDIHFRAAAIYAVARWNRVLERRTFQWVPRGPADITVTMVDKQNAVDTGEKLLGSWICREVKCCSGGTIRISRNTKWCTERRRRTMLHELAHALGLKHDDADSQKSVMSSKTPECGDKDMHDELSDDLIDRALMIIEPAVIFLKGVY